MRKLNLIARFVFRKNFRSFSWWSLVLTPLLALAVIGGIQWYMNRAEEAAKIVIVAPKSIATALKSQSNKDLIYSVAPDHKSAQRQLKNEDVDALLMTDSGADHAELYMRDSGIPVDKLAVQQSLSRLRTVTTAQEIGLSQAQLTKLTKSTQLDSKSVSFKADKMVIAAGKSDHLKTILSLAVGALMFAFLLSYGSIIAQEIATEKGSRIEESILTAIKASTQFYGKLMGIAALLAVQLGLYAVCSVLAWVLRDHVPLIKQFVSSINWSAIGWPFVLIMVIFFAIGVISYTVLAALCGSLVSNQEQSGMALQPVLYLGMIGYFATLSVSSGSGPILRVISYVPFLSPLIMPARFGVDQVGLGAVFGAILISVVFLIGFTLFSARTYRANVLVYSDSGLLKAFRKSIALGKHTN
jgi:ABC-2 type transport system permease protein